MVAARDGWGTLCGVCALMRRGWGGMAVGLGLGGGRRRLADNPTVMLMAVMAVKIFTQRESSMCVWFQQLWRALTLLLVVQILNIIELNQIELIVTIWTGVNFAHRLPMNRFA